MDRNDSNPGMVERQMDETPMEGRSVESDRAGNERERDGMGGMDRDSLRDSSGEREGMQGGSIDRDSMSGIGSQGGGEMRGSSPGQSLTGHESERLGESNTNSNPAEMTTSAREGGYGYDRPADLTVARDSMESSSRDTDQGTDRAPRVSDASDTDQPRGTTTARDW